MPTKPLEKTDRRLGMNTIQIEGELAAPLKEFGRKIQMPAAGVARVILGLGLPKLISGEWVIVNGEVAQNPNFKSPDLQAA